MYIPVLPIFLIDVLDAPQPFLIGAHVSVLDALPDAIASGENNIVVVDLDRDRICMSGNLEATNRRETKARARTKWARSTSAAPSAEALAAAAKDAPFHSDAKSSDTFPRHSLLHSGTAYSDDAAGSMCA